jgi:hypothetical protein
MLKFSAIISNKSAINGDYYNRQEKSRDAANNARINCASLASAELQRSFRLHSCRFRHQFDTNERNRSNWRLGSNSGRATLARAAVERAA